MTHATTSAPRSTVGLGVAGLAGATVVLCVMPWSTVAFPRFFELSGEAPAHETTTAGFLCLILSALTCVIIALDRSVDSKSDNRAGFSLVALCAMALTTAILLFEWFSGSPDYRNVSTVRTVWFYLALAAAVVATGCAAVHARAIAAGRPGRRA